MVSDPYPAPCCPCGVPAEIHLCASCHAQRRSAQHHATLVRQGLARAAGQPLGRPRTIRGSGHLCVHAVRRMSTILPATLITGTTSELARPYCASPDVPS